MKPGPLHFLLLIPPRSPNLNAYAERFVRTVRSECLDHIDLEEQRAAYAALTDVALGAEWLDGVLLWRWLGPGGPHDRWYTPRGKPAMAEASRLLQGRARGRDISDEHLERHAGLEPDDQRTTVCRPAGVRVARSGLPRWHGTR